MTGEIVKDEDFVQVYRIESEYGFGAYSLRPKWMAYGAEPPYEDAKHLTPEEDSALAPGWRNLTDRSDWYFGFASIEQMRAWFYSDNHLKALKEAGGKLVTYRVHKARVLIGHTQAVFKRGKAEKIEVAELI